jgi:hypothetical protein
VPHEGFEAPPGIGSGELCGGLSCYALRGKRHRSGRKQLPSRNRHLRVLRYASIPRTSGFENVGEDETVAFDDLAILHMDGPVEYGGIMDESVKLAVFSTRINLRGEAFE